MNATPIPADFWGQIDHQLKRIATERPDTFDKVRAILTDTAYAQIVDYTAELDADGTPIPNPYYYGNPDRAFFAGGGGDHTPAGPLSRSGWEFTRYREPFYYSMRHNVTGEVLSYVEGDVLRGQHVSAEAIPSPSGYFDAETGEAIDEDTLKERFDEMLDEACGPVKIGTLEWDASIALERLDPTAYRVEFSDWTSQELGETLIDDAQAAADLRDEDDA